MDIRIFLALVALVAIALVPLGIGIALLPETRVLLPLFIIITATMPFVAGLWALLLAQRHKRRIAPIAVALRRLGNRDFTTPFPIANSGEYATLGRTLNEARDKLAIDFVELVRDHEQFRAILSGMVEGVVALDDSQEVLFANDRACVLLELDAKTVTGRKIGELSREPAIQAIVDKALFQSGTCREELDWHGRETKHLAVYVSRLTGADSTGAVMVLHDITELRRLERLRQDFVANVSHELKTPLAVIQSNVEALQDGAVDDPNARGSFLDRIQLEGNRLDDLIQDLLKLARIESGERALDFTPADIGESIAECLERQATRAEEKSMSIIEVPPKNSPRDLRVWADDQQLELILDNLVDNAIKYTPNGGKITVRWEADPTHVKIEVEDNGIGVSSEDLPRIFERFYRVDKARSRSAGGTGLGLAIVKHLVQLLDGQIRVTSEPGVGTIFRVQLPRWESS